MPRGQPDARGRRGGARLRGRRRARRAARAASRARPRRCCSSPPWRAASCSRATCSSRAPRSTGCCSARCSASTAGTSRSRRPRRRSRSLATLTLGRAWAARGLRPRRRRRALGLPAGAADFLLLALVAVAAVAAIPAVGALLVTAIYVLPAAAARLLARSDPRAARLGARARAGGGRRSASISRTGSTCRRARRSPCSAPRPTPASLSLAWRCGDERAARRGARPPATAARRCCAR